MKTAVVLRHVGFEDVGAFEAPLCDAGYHLVTLDPHQIEARAVLASPRDLLVILGGPIGACDEAVYPFLRDELEIIEAQLSADAPLLGVCLGAQLIARALGARVYPMSRKEIGWAPISLTAEGAQSSLRHLLGHAVLHWHGDMFDLPAGATPLASTEMCANQAFSLGANTLALQFHCEADASRLEQWLVGHAVELAGAGVDVSSLRRDALVHGARTAQAGQASLSDWLSKTKSS